MCCHSFGVSFLRLTLDTCMYNIPRTTYCFPRPHSHTCTAIASFPYLSPNFCHYTSVKTSCRVEPGNEARFQYFQIMHHSPPGHIGTSQQQCEAAGCCWSPKDVSNWPTRLLSYVYNSCTLLCCRTMPGASILFQCMFLAPSATPH